MPITDTLETSRRLRQAGVPAEQAEVFSELFEETAKATQQDLKSFIVEQFTAFEKRVDARFAESELRMDARLAETEARVEGKIAESEARLETKLAEQGAQLRSEISQAESRAESHTSQVEARLLRELRFQLFWYFGFLTAFGTVIIGAIKLLFG